MTSNIECNGAEASPERESDRITRLEQLFDRLPEGLILIDKEGVILNWNAQAEHLLGWTNEQACGLKLHELILPAHFHTGGMKGLERLIKRKQGHGQYMELLVLTASGQEVPVELSIIPMDGDKSRTIAIVIRDIKTRKQHEFMLQMQRHILEMIATSKPVQLILDELCILIELEIPRSTCIIMRPDSTGEALHVEAGPNASEALKNAFAGLLPGPDQGSCGTAFHTQQPVFVSNTASDSRWQRYQQAVNDFNIQSCWSIPIRSNDETLGTFSVSLQYHAAPGNYELGLLQTASWLASIALVHDMNQQKIHLLAMHDDLTGLPNRKMLFNQLHDALETALDKKQTGAVMFLDLDNFKTINDSMGHRVGDEVLRETTRRLKELVGADDVVARMGGDEFIILQKNTTPEQARKLAEQVRESISRAMEIERIQARVTTSIGIALFPDDAVTTTNILKHADTAMYMAKHSGRNNIQFYLPIMDGESVSHEDMRCLLGSALDNNQLLSLIQPIVSAADDRLLGNEILLRWQHPTRGLLDATEFLPLVGRLGLVRELGQWSLNNAAELISRYKDKFPIDSDHRLSVNISSRYFLMDEFDTDIQQAFNEAPCNLGCLLLEITLESDSSEYDRLTEKLRSYHQHDAKLAIDNLGMDHVSLYSQGLLPVDYVKLDVSLVREIPLSYTSVKTLNSLIDVAHANHQQVVAVGVESRAQLDYLRKQGCDAYQGYLYCEPLKPEDLIAILNAEN